MGRLRQTWVFGIVWLCLGWAVLPGARILADPPGQSRTPLSYGQTVVGIIDDAQFFHQYSFTGSAGDSVIITMEATSGNLDPLVLLGDGDLNLIAEDDDSGGGFNARLEVVLPADGVYVIEATRYGQDDEVGQSTGAFQLTLIANQAAAGNATLAGILASLDFGDTARGILTPDNPFHLFWFQAQAGDQVRIQSVIGVGVPAALYLYSSTFAVLAYDPVGREASVEIADGGVYFAALVLTGPVDSPSAGTYALALTGSVDSPATDAVVLPLAFGQTIQGTISSDRVIERYSFTGQANAQVLIRMEAPDSTLDPFLYLYGPGGEIIGQDDDSAPGSGAELAVVLPEAGQYTIVATRFGRENGTTEGGYLLSLRSSGAADPGSNEMITFERAMPDDFAGLPRLLYGDAVEGTIDADNYFRPYVFEARAGNEVVITMENVAGDLDPVVLLVDETLRTIAEHDDISAENTNARLTFVIPTDGFYAILATRYRGEEGTTTGGFLLTLHATNVSRHSRVATLLPSAVLLPETTAEGRIDEAFVVFYSLYAASGDRLDISLQTSGLLEEEALLLLTDADLSPLVASGTGQLRYAAREDGLYLLVVTRRGGPIGQARGFFTVILTGATAVPPPAVDAEDALGPGSVLPYGTIVSDFISDAQPEVRYYFDGQAGDRVTVRLEALEATLDPLVIVVGPDGEELLRDDDSAGDFNALITSYLLTVDGRYTLVASRFGGLQGSSRGQFELTLAGVPVSQPETSGAQSGAEAGAALLLGQGQTVSGAVSDESVAVFYAFQGTAGTAIEIDMVSVDGDLDPLLALLDAGQNLLATDDDSGGSRNARLRFTLPADGLYYIIATRFEWFEGNTAGEYLLSLIAR